MQFISAWPILCFLYIVGYCCWRRYEYTNLLRSYGSDRLLFARLSTFESGGIGNNVFELISSIGIARVTGRTLILPNDVYEKISMNHSELPNLLNGIYPETEGTSSHHFPIDKRMSDCCRYDSDVIEQIKKRTSKVVTVYLSYLQSYLYFATLSREEIFSRLELSSETESKVNKEISELTGTWNYDNILCVHSRRGDYLTTGLHSPSSSSFLLKATNEVYKKLGSNSTLVLLIGDDKKWQESIANTLQHDGKSAVVLPRLKTFSSPVADWDVSRKYCDTVLLTASSSTFGWWLAFLSKGQKVYYNSEFARNPLLRNQLEAAHFFPPSWTPLNYSF